MNERNDEPINELTRLHLTFCQLAEQTEALGQDVNRMFDPMVRLGIVSDTIILGPVIRELDYPVWQQRTDSSQAIQAALHVPKGLGVIYWDTEELYNLQGDPDELKAVAWSRFQPLGDCEFLQRAFLLPHVAGLLEKFEQLIS